MGFHRLSWLYFVKQPKNIIWQTNLFDSYLQKWMNLLQIELTENKPADMNIKWVKNIDKPKSPRKTLVNTRTPPDKNRLIEPDTKCKKQTNVLKDKEGVREACTAEQYIGFWIFNCTGCETGRPNYNKTSIRNNQYFCLWGVSCNCESHFLKSYLSRNTAIRLLLAS